MTMEIRLHGSLWRQASAARAEEWRRALGELNAENQLSACDVAPADDPALELVRMPSGQFVFRLYRHGIERIDALELAPSRVSELFEDYAATIRHMVHMDRSAPARGFESLDYAKRVVHEEAAEYLGKALSPLLEAPREDVRRLFTLIFLVGTDIPDEWIRYHRRH